MTWKYTFIPRRKIHHSSANQEKGNILKCTFTPRIIEKDKAKMTQKYTIALHQKLKSMSTSANH